MLVVLERCDRRLAEVVRDRITFPVIYVSLSSISVHEARNSIPGTIFTAMFFMTRLVPRRRDDFEMEQDAHTEEEEEAVVIKEEEEVYHAD